MIAHDENMSEVQVSEREREREREFRACVVYCNDEGAQCLASLSLCRSLCHSAKPSRSWPDSCYCSCRNSTNTHNHRLACRALTLRFLCPLFEVPLFR